ncbi:MAG: hypothetical protein V3U59_01065, partial [Gammaproteobacteria bacterium]
MSYAWHDFLGNSGVALIVGSYLLVQLDRLDARSVVYTLANAIGAALILISLKFEFNLSALIVEAFWLLISLIG